CRFGAFGRGHVRTRSTAMKARHLIALMLFAGLATSPACGGTAPTESGAVKLQGAGASFPAPLYTKWFKSYSAAHQNVLVDYQSVGSGSSVKSVLDHTVDFGASDAALKPEDMSKVADDGQAIPRAPPPRPNPH